MANAVHLDEEDTAVSSTFVTPEEFSNCLNGVVMVNAVHLDEEDTAVNGDCGRGPPA